MLARPITSPRANNTHEQRLDNSERSLFRKEKERATTKEYDLRKITLFSGYSSTGRASADKSKVTGSSPVAPTMEIKKMN